MTALLKPSSMARGLTALYSSALLAGMWSMIVPAVPVIAKSFGVTPGTAAQVITALAFGRFAGMPISGTVLDRLGTRTALRSGPALACSAAVLAGITPWFSLILALVFLIGVGESIWVIAREVAGIDLARLDQRGRVLSGFHGINNLGLALGPLFGGLLTEAVGFRAAFFGYAVCAMTAVFIGGTVGGSQVTAPAHGGSIDAWNWGALVRHLRGLKDLFHQIDPDLRATYVVLVFATLTSFVHRVTTQSMLPLLATAKLGLSPKEVGMLFTISGAAVFTMILPAGFVIDKIGRKWATVPSTGIPALAFLLIPFAGSFSQLAVLIAFLGLANGMSLGSLATSTFDVVPASARGRLQAARRAIAESGSVSAPLIGGILADRFNPGVPFLAYAPLLILSAILLAAVGRETLQK
ncbi:MAG TPA: MFS transporter [Terriglobales bacterium]|jgi:MFS family permease|nr:MFS transporter [Terriglobales bacterium]